MGRLLDTYRAQKGQPQKEGESEQQKSPSPKGKRLLRSLSVIVATLLITTCVMGLYILTAPVIEAPQEPA